MPELPEYAEVIARISLREKAAQLFMPAAFINDSETEIRALESLIRTCQVGGLCFFHSRASAATNFEGRREIPYNENSLDRLQLLIQRYQKAANYPLLIAMDAEWGLGMRVENGSKYPYALTLGALPQDSEGLLYELGLHMARDCREVGIHLNLAPVVDVNSNPDNPVISYRAFGSDPEAVSRKAVRMNRGFTDGGLLSCAKHFPGHGDTDVDSHLNLPVLHKNISQLEAEELIPFRELIKAKIPAMMTGHLSLPKLDSSGLPASLSKPIISLLRDMGFEGTVITDALNMHALRGIEAQAEDLNIRALHAGNDLLCYADRIDESIELFVERADKSRIEASFRRIWHLKEQVFNAPANFVNPKDSRENLNRELARNCICEIGMTEELLPEFRVEGFSLLSVGAIPKAFIHSLNNELNFEHFPAPTGEGLRELLPSKGQNILLTLFPPDMKPKDFFGLKDSLIDELLSLAADHRIVLYLFGNPYLLSKLRVDHFDGVLCAFQSLPIFQEMAGAHFLGRLKATGQLPIKIAT